MKYAIEKENNIPAYLQLYYQIRKDIESGAYLYGQKLPSKRILAEEVGMSVITVEHTYALLCDEGYAESKQRSGYRIIYKESDFLSHAQDKDDCDFGNHISKEPNIEKGLFPFSVLSKAMRRVILDYGESIFCKAENKGCIQLRKAISKYLNRTVGIKADPEQIIIGAGAEYLYGLIAQLLGNKQIYALENPSYSKIRQVYEAHGVSCDMLDMGRKGIKSSQLHRSRAKILHVTPYNSYPSLITADASKRREYLNWIIERKGILIEDNYDSELTVSKKNEETIFSLSEENNVIYINTFSHTISSSLRIGYMVLPIDIINQFDEKLGFYSCTVSVFEQYVLSELIDSGEFERQINKMRREKRKALQSGYMK
ncbi:MAG: PLP-dependent aminotransferase family protein [Clostridium sartagoforme]|nr:PLP-dependent aminotransferase family protein [Clostridium sartagoforme]